MTDTTPTNSIPGDPPVAGSGSPDGPAEPTTRRWPVLVAVVIGVGLLGRLLFAVDAPANVLLLPEAGTVRAAQLDDGTPVFASHLADDTVHVVEAFGTVDGPIGSLVGWCPAARQFVDPHLGALYDPAGLRYSAAIDGRAPADLVALDAPTHDDDLTSREFERIEGRGDAEDPLRIEEQVEPTDTRGAASSPLAGGRPLGTPTSCRVEPEPLVPPLDAAPPAVNRMLDHSFQATLLRLPRDGWHITDGWLVVGRDGTTTWCRQDPATIPPTCPDEAPVPIDVTISPADTGGGWAVIGGPLAARVSDRRVVELAVLPRSTWRGSSLRGATRHEAVLRHVWDRRGEVELELPADVQEVPSCMDGDDASRSPLVARVEIAADTQFEVDGETDPLTLATSPADDPMAVPVEVLVDDVTCRALLVRSAT